MYYDDALAPDGASCHVLVYAGLLAAYRLADGGAWIEHCYLYDKVRFRHTLLRLPLIVCSCSAGACGACLSFFGAPCVAMHAVFEAVGKVKPWQVFQ